MWKLKVRRYMKSSELLNAAFNLSVAARRVILNKLRIKAGVLASRDRPYLSKTFATTYRLVATTPF